MVKRGGKKPSFNDFARFLEKQRQIVVCMADMEESEEQRKETEPKVEAASEETNSDQ